MDDYLPVAEQLNLLFEAVRHPDGRPYTLQEVADRTGISVGTLSQMRGGRIKNPQLNTLRVLCRFFGVPLRYFETCTLDECYALLTPSPTETTPLNEIAFRASGLSPRSQRDILTIIKWVQAAEAQQGDGAGLPPLPNLESDDEDSDP
jgi:transcriptional regulator with XRE-family HTH domain